MLFIDSRDWRAHLEQMKQHRAGLQDTLSSATAQLARLASDVTSSLNKIHSRDKFLNSQLEPLLYQYRTVQVCKGMNTVKPGWSLTRRYISYFQALG